MNKRNKTNKGMMMFALMAIMLTLAVPMVLAADLSLTFDMNSGIITVQNDGNDASTWHPGAIGQSSGFVAVGDVIGTYDSTEGVYGKLATYVSAYTDVGGGMFHATDYMNFNVLSANHNYNTEGYFTAHAEGAYAEMNMKFIGSMYVWSEADDGGINNLVGQNIYKTADVYQNNVCEGSIGIGIVTDGQAYMDNQNAWGFGIGEHGTVTADYNSGVNYIGSTGTGIYTQTAFGKDYLEFNGIVLNGGGSASIIGGFTGGYADTFTMAGN